MADKIGPDISQFGHRLARDVAQVRRANVWLEAARGRAGPLNLDGVSLSLRHIHFSSGPFATGRGAGAHRHEALQLETVLTGRFHFTAGPCAHVLCSGQGNLILPGVAHAWDCEESGIMLGVLVDTVGPRREDFLAACAEAPGQPLPRFGSAADRRALRDILVLLTAPRQGVWWREDLGARLGLWLAAVLRDALPLGGWGGANGAEAARVQEPGGFGAAVVRQAMEFMDANCDTPLAVADVALQVGLSARHLNRLFRQERGGTVAATLNRIRLQRAWALLEAEPGRPVKQVAYAVGFARPAYFTSCFRKSFGCLPSAVGRRARHA